MNFEEFESILSGPFAKFLSISQQIGSIVVQQCEIAEKAFNLQLKLLESIVKHNKIDSIQKTLESQLCFQLVHKIQEFKIKNRDLQFTNHLYAVSEGVLALGWVSVNSAPLDFIKEIINSVKYYTDRILKEHKEKDNNHEEWVKEWIEILTQFYSFIKKYFTNGLCSINMSFPQSQTSNSIKRFNEQNEKSPKNDLESKFLREGKKWIVENQKGKHNLLINEPEMNNTVYIFKCVDSTITINKKLNTIILDSCEKFNITFDTVISCIEFINCQSMQMQVLGKVQTIVIEKTDGCQIYLNDESLNVEIVSSKSSQLNVLVPDNNSEYKEYPIPEQYKTIYVAGKGLSTVAIENKI